MSQGDYNIQNQGFPAFRSDLNSTLSAINSSNSGTSRPSSAVAGTVWLDTTSATTPTLKFYDGADDISLATLDYSANTVNWLDSTVAADLVNDTTPQLGGNLDVNGNSIVSVSNGNITFTPDGTGKVIIDGLSHPTADGTSGQNLITDGAGNLSFSNVTPADNTVSLAKLTATGTKDATTFLRGDNTFAEPAAGGITMADQWRLSAHITSNQEPVSSNLERNDSTGFGYVGSGMSVSSGIWTFPETGIYLVQFHLIGYPNTNDDIYGYIQATTNNSTYNDHARTAISRDGNGQDGSTCSTLVDVTDTANVKVRFLVNDLSAGSAVHGYTDFNATHFVFIRLGDT